MSWRKAAKKAPPLLAFTETELAGDSDAELWDRLQRPIAHTSAADAKALAKAVEHLRRRGLKVPLSDVEDGDVPQ